MYIQDMYTNKPSIAVMHKLFNSCDVKLLSNMVKFINIINAVCTSLYACCVFCIFLVEVYV